MAGLMSGIQVAKTGLLTHAVMQQVVGQNIANAANEDYTRQSARMTSLGSQHQGMGFLGEGVETAQILRIRDTLLDTQLRNTMSSTANYEVEGQWLQKIQATFNEPSDSGLNTALSKFWEGWSELAGNPESFASRSTVMARTENLTTMIRELDSKFANFGEEIDQALGQSLDEINDITEEIKQLNDDIFQIEAGRTGQANDLHDKRDAALDRLSEKVDIEYHTAKNGMINVYIGGHPAVLENHHEKLVTKLNTFDSSKLDVAWEYGERLGNIQKGELAGILNVRDSIIPSYRTELDNMVKTFMHEVNRVYSNGLGSEGQKVLESRLGYESLGVDSAADALSLVEPGEYGSLHLSFYNSQNEVVRSAGILIDEGDSLADIAAKLDAIQGVDATIISDINNDGKLRVQLDEISGENSLGEVSLGVSNNTGGYDSSGLLNLLGFSQTDKSTNTSAAAPLLASRDLTELQTTLGVGTLAEVRSEALGLAGQFTINAFETMTEDSPKTNGHHVQQFTIEVESSDSIDDIIAKINNLTAQYGVSASVNATTNQLELTSSAQTDSEGNVVLSGGTDYLRLGFANDYRHPAVPEDEAPAGYDGRADTTGILATMQMNTLLQGRGSRDIALDDRIVGAEDIHAGTQLSSGSNETAIALAKLQHARIAVDGQFTVGEQYQNLVATAGNDVQHTQHLFDNENLMKESFRTEKDRISGVNLDEELGNMILFQRAFDANSRMLATWNQMTQELLNAVG